MYDPQHPPVPDQIRTWVEELKAQRQEAEDAIFAAQQRIADIDTDLPDLERILDRHGNRDSNVAAPAIDPEPLDHSGEPVLRELRSAEDVQREAANCSPELQPRFVLVELEAVLGARGFRVNQSTLRKNLTDMVRMGNTYRIGVEGKGRRATVFEKLGRNDLLKQLQEI